MTVLHATEAATVHLSLWARVHDLQVADVDRALYDARTLVKQVAMRRTTFLVPRELLPAVWGSASARAVGQQRRTLERRLHAAGFEAPDAWIAAAREAVLARLRGGEELSAPQLREQVPELAGSFVEGPGTSWGGEYPLAPSALALFAAEGVLVRATNAGLWRVAKPTWTATSAWLGAAESLAAPWPSARGYAELTRRWLWTFGPGTEDDLVWWLGATKSVVRRALADVGAVSVALEDGGTGWLLPDDLDPVEPVAPWASLLPTLDPTPMGWRDRAFYVDPALAAYFFDGGGNAGTSAWWDGRMVGCWLQDGDGVVRLVLHVDIGDEGRAALEREAARLTDWLAGQRIDNVYASRQRRAQPLGRTPRM
jgi:hypothetical protein